MTSFATAVTQRELIQDPAVIEEFDRLNAKLNGFLSGLGQRNVESLLEEGIDSTPGVQITTFADLQGPFILPATSIALSSDYADLDPGDKTILRLTPVGAARTLSGIRGGQNGRQLILYVPASALQTLTFAHEAAGADANKRISLVGAADLVTVVGQVRGVTLLYDGTDQRWTQIGGSAAIAAAATRAVVESHTQAGTPATTAETDLVTGTVPANTLSANGDVLLIRAYGNFADNAQGKRLRFYWNGTAVADTTAQAWQDRGWQLLALITRTGSAAQKGHALFIPAIAGTSPQPGEFFSDTADLTAGVAIKITGQNSTGTANDIQFEGWLAHRIGAV